MITITSETDEYIKFTVKNKTPGLVNAIRRSAISRVPTIAVENILIKENDSVDINEIIEDRLMMIPLTTSLDTIKKFNYKNECDLCGAGCNRCEVTLRLSVNNDSEDPSYLRTVYASDIEILDSPGVTISEDNKTIPITVLKSGQSLYLNAIAVRGIGAIHTKWSPAGTVHYNFAPIVEVDLVKYKKLKDSDKTRFIESCPKKVFKRDSGPRLIKINKNSCIFCNECVKVSQTLDIEDIGTPLVEVSPDESTVLFTAETTGALRPRDIIILALESLDENITGIINKLQE